MRGNSKRTSRYYADRLKALDEAFGNRKAKSLEVEELQEHFHQFATTLSPTTQGHNITACVQLMKFAMDRGELKHPWFKSKDIPKPKANSRDVIPTPEEMAQVLSVMRQDAQPIVRSLWLTGARPGELCSAEVRHLDGTTPGERSILLTEHKTARKTGMKREIFLSPAAEGYVVEAIGDRAEGHIFRTVTGLHWNVTRLSREFRRCRNCFPNISKQIVLYSLRHAAASLMIDAGADISAVKVALGHTDIGTTQKYVHPDKKTVRSSIRHLRDVMPLKAAG